MRVKAIFMLAISAIVIGKSANAATQTSPAPAAPALQQWKNATLDPDARADLLIKVMTLQEKQALVFGYFSTDQPSLHYIRPNGGMVDAAGFIEDNPRLGIPVQSLTDAGLGVASQPGLGPRLRTALPSGLATAATWNREVALAGGAMIGNEARLSGFNIMLAGGANLMRDPRDGRTFEYAGEDPLLAGTIVGHVIEGIQSNHIISTLKHFAFHDQQTDRFTIDVKINDASGRQSDLLALQLANEIGRPGAVMCAYNRVNGAYACENEWLLNQVLKADWGFRGYVMSDWGATHSTIPAANAGLDQQMGYPLDRSPYFSDALVEAVENGWVKPSRLDDMVHRILRTMFSAGLFEKPVSDQSATIDYIDHAAISRADAEEAIVLLKNDADILPIARSVGSILVVGGHADVGVISGGGSSQVYPLGGPKNGMITANEGPAEFPGPTVYFPSSPIAALRQRTKATINYVDGKNIAETVAAAATADLVLVFATQWAAEKIDVSLNLSGHQDALISAVAKCNHKTVVVLETGGPVMMPWLRAVRSVVEAWYPGTSGGVAIARVLTGEVNPSGRLPVSFVASVDQLPRRTMDADTEQSGHPHTDYDIEGAAVGYKWLDKKALTPLFPFGYGLSYTTFAWSGLSAKAVGNGLAVSVMLTNSGAVDGKAVTQVYLAAPASAGWEAPKRLAAFSKTFVRAGESKSVSLTVDPKLLATWDIAAHRWKIVPGDYKLMTGTSAVDLDPPVTVHLDGHTLNALGN